jgi:hypothetical protein
MYSTCFHHHNSSCRYQNLCRALSFICVTEQRAKLLMKLVRVCLYVFVTAKCSDFKYYIIFVTEGVK